MTDVAKVLNDAADLIERVGWSQYVAWGPNGERCPVAAVIDVAPDGNLSEDALEALRAYVGDRLLGGWNAEQRSPESVIAALRAAATATAGKGAA
jgi:hypothetical protein